MAARRRDTGVSFVPLSRGLLSSPTVADGDESAMNPERASSMPDETLV
jgi:hypothetical protein